MKAAHLTLEDELLHEQLHRLSLTYLAETACFTAAAGARPAVLVLSSSIAGLGSFSSRRVKLNPARGTRAGFRNWLQP
eukprot:5714398-Pleurochrysis_carterae.AAC.1